MTIDSNRNVGVYLNGKTIGQAVHNIISWEPSAGDANTPLTIGSLYPYGCGWAGNTGFSFDGLIDEPQIYNAALTQSVIQQLYAQGLKTHQNFAKK